MPRCRHAGAHPVAIAHNQRHKPGARRLKAWGLKKRAEVSIRWCDFFRVFCSVWFTLVCSVVSSKSALIGSSSPVSRSSSSSKHILFSLLLFLSLESLPPRVSLLVLARL